MFQTMAFAWGLWKRILQPLLIASYHFCLCTCAGFARWLGCDHPITDQSHASQGQREPACLQQGLQFYQNHLFSSASLRSEAADGSLWRGEARYFWTVKQQLSRNTWSGGIRWLWLKVGTVNPNVSMNLHSCHICGYYKGFKVGNKIMC